MRRHRVDPSTAGPSRARMAAVMVVLTLAVAGCGAGAEQEPAAGASAAPASSSPETGGASEQTASASPAGAPEPATSAGEAAAEGDAARFAGETVSLVVPYSPGGGYDVYLRALAPHIERIGDVTTVVENRPGAGGLLAASQLFVATGDPSQVLISNGPGYASAWLVGAEGVQFELDEFTILGRLVSEPHVLGVAADSEIETFEELLQTDDLTWGVTGPGSTALINATVLNEVFDRSIETVAGFEGSGELQTALARGDIDVMSIEPSSALAAIEADQFTPLMYISDAPSPLLPEVATITDLDLTAEQSELLDVHFALFDVGRALLAPPGLAEEDAAGLRALVEAAATSPEFVAESEEGNRPLDFASGEEVAELLETVAAAPDSYVQLIEQAYEG